MLSGPPPSSDLSFTTMTSDDLPPSPHSLKSEMGPNSMVWAVSLTVVDRGVGWTEAKASIPITENHFYFIFIVFSKFYFFIVFFKIFYYIFIRDLFLTLGAAGPTSSFTLYLYL